MLGIITITGKGEPGLRCSPEAGAGGVNAVFPLTSIWVWTSRSVVRHTDGRNSLSVLAFDQKSIFPVAQQGPDIPKVFILPAQESFGCA